jgi:hypothetical protein
MDYSDLFETANGVLPVAVPLRQYRTRMHKSHTHRHISHKIISLKTNKTKENKSAHKATQTVKDILQPMNTE